MAQPGQKEAATQEFSRQPADRPSHAPPPVQQQDMRRVEADTDRSVQRSLDHGSGLERRMPQSAIEQRANTIIQSASQLRGHQIAGHDYTPQADIIIQTARRAMETGDPSLIDKATYDVFLLSNMAGAQVRGEASGTEDGKAVSGSMQRGMGMFGTDQGNDRLAYSSDAARSVLDNQRAIDAPENRGGRARLLGTIDRLADPSVSMTAADARAAFNSVQQGITLACARAGESEQFRNLAVQIQALLASSAAREGMKDQLDKLLDDLAKGLSKPADSKKERDEKEKDASEIEARVEKLAASALESLLAEAGAPPELISALKGSGKMLESNVAAVRERGRQMLQLGIAFLQNRSMILSDRSLLGKLISTARLFSDTKTDKKKAAEGLASLQKDILKAMEAEAKVKTERLGALEGLSKTVQGMLKDIDRVGSKPLRESADRLIAYIQDRLKSGEISADFVKGIEKMAGDLKGSLAAILKLPAKTGKEKEARNESAGLLAKALDSAMKDPKSEVTSLLRFISGLQISAENAERRSFLAKLGDALSGGRMTADEAKGELSKRIIKDGDEAESALRKASPKLADAFASLLKPLRAGKPNTGDLSKASKALDISDFLISKALPKGNESVKSGLFSLIGKALSALQAGDGETVSGLMVYSAKLADAPDESAPELADNVQKALKQSDKKAKDGFAGRRNSLLMSLPSLPKELQERAGKLLDEMKAARDDFDSMPESSIAELAFRAQEISRMAGEVEKADYFELKANLAKLFATALGRLESGDKEKYGLLILASKEMEANPGFDHESAAYRKEIMEQVAAMDSPEKAEAAFSKLAGIVKKHLSLGLERESKSAPGELGQSIRAIEISDDPESLARASKALAIAKSMDGYLVSAAGRKLTSGEKDAAMRIYGRAFAAISSGEDLSAAGAQGFLADKYISSKDDSQRKDIEALSARLEQDRGALKDIDEYINFSNRSSIAKAKISELPKNSPLAATLGEISDETDRMEGLAARGEDGLDEDTLAKYRNLVTERLKDPKLKAQLGQSARIIEERDGVTSEQAMDRAVGDIVRSTAKLEEEQRFSGLLQLRDLALAAGPYPKKELAGLIQECSKALIEGNLGMGSLYLQGIKASLASPDELDNVVRATEDCESGVSTLSCGMLRIGISGERKGYQGRITDQKLLANAKAYFDLAEIAAGNGDAVGAEEIRRLAIAYSTLAAIREPSLDKEGKDKRADAISSIESDLGDYKGIAPEKRVSDSDTVSSPIARAVLSKVALKDALGDGFAQLDADCGSLSESAYSLSRISDMDGLTGKNSEAGWNAERKRLLDKADKSRSEGHGELAEYYENQAEYADFGAFRDYAAKAKEMLKASSDDLEKYSALMAEADSLKAKAAQDSGSGADELNKRADAAVSEAMAAKEDADKLRAAAAVICNDLGSLDESILKINTVHREKGRSQLSTSVKTCIAVALGYDVDMLGNRRDGDLDSARAEELFGDASEETEEGRMEIKAQRDIMRTRDAGLANAWNALHANYYKNARDIVGRIIAGIPDNGIRESRGKDLKEIFPDGGKRDLDDKDTYDLGELYKLASHQLGTEKSFKDSDGKEVPTIDPEKNEQNYRQVTGYFWSENFSAANYFLRSSKMDANARFLIANLQLDDKLLGDQHKSACGPKDTGFPVGSRGAIDKSDYFLLKQIIAYIPAAKQDEYLKKLDATKRGPDGNFERQRLYDELAPYSESMSGNKEKIDKILNGDMIYFDYDSLLAKAVDIRGLARTDIGAAESQLDDLSRTVDRRVNLQVADNDRISFDYREFDYNARFWKANRLFFEVPERLPDYYSGEEKTRRLKEIRDADKANRTMKPAIETLQTSLEQREAENKKASKDALERANSIISSGNAVNLDDKAVASSLIANLEEIAGDIDDSKAKEMLGRFQQADPEKQNEMLPELWGYLRKDAPELLVKALGHAYKVKDPSFSEDDFKQLNALTYGVQTIERNMEWDTAIEPYVSKRLQTGLTLEARAMSSADEEERRKLYEVIDPVFDTARVLSGDGYGWTKDPYRMKAMWKNDYDANVAAFGILLDKEKAFSHEIVEAKDRESYAKKLAAEKTDMELWLSGFRRIGGDKEDIRKIDRLEKFDLTRDEYKRISEAYGQFAALEKDIYEKAGKGYWEKDEKGWLDKILSKDDRFYQSAKVIADDPGSGSAIPESEKLYQEGVPAKLVGGQMYSPDKELKSWEESKQNWEEATVWTKKALWTVGTVGGLILGPFTGGTTAVMAAGVGATKGFIEAADYYEACGSDFSGMSWREQANFAFQMGMAAAAVAAPVMGELSAARNIAVSLDAGLEAEGLYVPEMLETVNFWVGKTMMVGGIYSSASSIDKLYGAYLSGKLSLWSLIAQSALEVPGAAGPAIIEYRSLDVGLAPEPAVRSDARQIAEMILFAIPLDDVTAINTAWVSKAKRYYLDGEYSKLTVPSKEAFDKYVSEAGLSAQSELDLKLDLFKRYQEAQSVDGLITFEDFLRIYDRFQEYGSGGGNFEAYVRTDSLPNRAVLETDELRARGKAVREAKADIALGTSMVEMYKLAEEMEVRASKLPPEKREEAINLLRLAEAYRREAKREQNRNEDGLRKTFDDAMPTSGTGDDAFLTPNIPRIAVEAAIGIDQVLTNHLTFDQAVKRTAENLGNQGIKITRDELKAVMGRLRADKDFIGGSEKAKSGGQGGERGRLAEASRALAVTSDYFMNPPAGGLRHPEGLGAREEFSGALNSIKVGDESCFTAESGKPAEAYSQKNSVLATKIAFEANRIIEGKTDLDKATADTIEDLKKQGIATEYDSIRPAIEYLFQDQAFIRGSKISRFSKRGRALQMKMALQLSSVTKGMDPAKKIEQ